MVAKVAHPQKTRQEKQVKAQEMVKEPPQKEMAAVKGRLMAEKVAVKVTEMVTERERVKARAEMAHVILAENRVKNALAIVLPKMAMLNQQMTRKMQAGMAAIQIVPHYLPKTKMHSNNALKKPKMEGIQPKKPCRMQIVKKH